MGTHHRAHAARWWKNRRLPTTPRAIRSAERDPKQKADEPEIKIEASCQEGDSQETKSQKSCQNKQQKAAYLSQSVTARPQDGPKIVARGRCRVRSIRRRWRRLEPAAPMKLRRVDERDVARVGVSGVERAEQFDEALGPRSGFRHGGGAHGATHETVEIERLTIGKFDEFGGREHAAALDDARVESHALDDAFAVDLQDRRAIAAVSASSWLRRFHMIARRPPRRRTRPSSRSASVARNQ
jgi:hypothetical protein